MPRGKPYVPQIGDIHYLFDGEFEIVGRDKDEDGWPESWVLLALKDCSVVSLGAELRGSIYDLRSWHCGAIRAKNWRRPSTEPQTGALEYLTALGELDGH